MVHECGKSRLILSEFAPEPGDINDFVALTKFQTDVSGYSLSDLHTCSFISISEPLCGR